MPTTSKPRKKKKLKVIKIASESTKEKTNDPALEKHTAVEKANDLAFEALKQIITLSSAILGFSVTFAKELQVSSGFQILLPICWALLIFSIIFSWLALVEATYALEAMENKLRYVFTYSTNPTPSTSPSLEKLNEIRRKAKRYARFAQGAFILGLFALGVFGFIAYQEKNLSNASLQSGQTIQVTLEVYPQVIYPTPIIVQTTISNATPTKTPANTPTISPQPTPTNIVLSPTP